MRSSRKTDGVVAAGDMLTAVCGVRLMEKGGNAIDAGAVSMAGIWPGASIAAIS